MKNARRPPGHVQFRHSLSYQLREIIESRGLTAYAVGQLSGVDPGVVSRFLTGKRGLMSGTLDRLAAALGLRLLEVGRAGRPRVRLRPPADGSTAAEGATAEAVGDPGAEN